MANKRGPKAKTESGRAATAGGKKIPTVKSTPSSSSKRGGHHKQKSTRTTEVKAKPVAVDEVIKEEMKVVTSSVISHSPSKNSTSSSSKKDEESANKEVVMNPGMDDETKNEVPVKTSVSEQSLETFEISGNVVCDLEPKIDSPIVIDLDSDNESGQDVRDVVPKETEVIPNQTDVIPERTETETETTTQDKVEKVIDKDEEKEMESKKQEALRNVDDASKRMDEEVPMEIDAENTKLEDLLSLKKPVKKKLPTSRSGDIKIENPLKASPSKKLVPVEPRVMQTPDIMLVAGNERKPTCSSLICEHSAHIRKIFEARSAKKTIGLLKIEVDVDSSVLGLLVKKTRDKKISLTPDEALQLFKPAIKLEMDLLKESCLHAMMGKITGENWLRLKLLAIETSSVDLHRIVDTTVDANPNAILPSLLKSKNFLELSLEELAKLLWKKNLSINNSLIHKMTEAWLAHEKRGENQMIYSQLKLLELLREEDRLELSIFDGKSSSCPPIQIDTPGWIFLQSLVTPKQLSLKTLDLSHCCHEIVNKAKVSNQQTMSVEEKVKNRKRMLDFPDDVESAKRRNIKQEVSLPRIPKVTIKSPISDENSKSWDPLGTSSHQAGNTGVGRNGYGEETRNRTPRKTGMQEPRKTPSCSFNEDDWNAPLNSSKDDENWDAGSNFGGAKPRVADDWGSGSEPTSQWGASDSNRGNFQSKVSRNNSSDGYSSGQSESPWDKKGNAWGRKSSDSAMNNSRPPNNNSSNVDDEDWGDSSKPSVPSWGAPPSNNWKNDSRPRSNDGRSRNDSGSSWGDNGGSSWGDSNKNSGSSFGDTGKGTDSSWDDSASKPGDSWGSSNDSGSTWGRRDSGNGSSWGGDNRRDSGGRGRGGDRGGRGGRGAGRGRGGGGPREPRDGDWACDKCNFATNFAFKTECFKCKEPKPGGASNGSGRGGRGRGGGNSRGRGGFSNTGGWGGNTSSNLGDDWGASSSSAAPAAVLDDEDWDAPSTAPAVTTTTPAPKLQDNDDWGEPSKAPVSVPKPSVSKPSNDDDWGDTPASQVTPKVTNDDEWGEPASSKPLQSTSKPSMESGWGKSSPLAPQVVAKPTDDDEWGEPSPIQAQERKPATPVQSFVSRTTGDTTKMLGKLSGPDALPLRKQEDDWGDNSETVKMQSPLHHKPEPMLPSLREPSFQSTPPRIEVGFLSPPSDFPLPDPRLLRRSSQEPVSIIMPPEDINRIVPPPIIKYPWAVSRIDGVIPKKDLEEVEDIGNPNMTTPTEEEKPPVEIPVNSREDTALADPRTAKGTVNINGIAGNEVLIPIANVVSSDDLAAPAPPPSTIEEWD